MSVIRQGLESADLDVPVVLPTLNLDFANSQSLDKRITFSRGSIGTRVNRNGLIETIPANQPRFDFDPISGECRGLLIEESRTNLLTYSEDFSNGIWTKSKGGVALTPVVTSNDVTSSSGELTADKVVFDISGGTTTTEFSFLAQSYSSVSGTTYTVSAWVRVDSGTSNIFIDCESGNTNIVQVTSTWQRFSFTRTSGSSGGKTVRIGLRGNVATSKSATIYLWGAQLEAGSFPTSYIPTTASTVTRSADNADMTGTNFSSWYNSTEGTVFCSFKTDGISGNPRTFQLTGNNQNERLDHRITGTTNGSEYYTGGINFGRIDDSGVTNPSQGKIIVSQNSRSRQFCMNGRTVKSATIPNAPAVNTLNIGNYNLQATYLNGTIEKLAYYPKALSPAELQYLTQ